MRYTGLDKGVASPAPPDPRRPQEQGGGVGVLLTHYPTTLTAVTPMCNAISQRCGPDGVVGLDELVDRYVAPAIVGVEYRPRVPRRPSAGHDSRLNYARTAV